MGSKRKLICICITTFVSVTLLTRTADAFMGTSSKARFSTVPLLKTLPFCTSLALSTTSDENSASDNDDDDAEAIDLSLDKRLYRVRLPRAPGIEWGTDLSFSFVYVRDMEPSGPASISGKVNVGDQLCELQAVVDPQSDTKPINLLGAPFDFVMTAFAGLDKTVKDVDLVFFRGTKEELKEACTGDGASGKEPETVTITVIQDKGSPNEQVRQLIKPAGCNLREVLTEEGINVYQSFTRWTNCKGKQLCGTCIVNVPEGSINTNRKSMDEASTLRENPDSYRLSCITFVYGDMTVETFPPIKASQWTR